MRSGAHDLVQWQVCICLSTHFRGVALQGGQSQCPHLSDHIDEFICSTTSSARCQQTGDLMAIDKIRVEDNMA